MCRHFLITHFYPINYLSEGSERRKVKEIEIPRVPLFINRNIHFARYQQVPCANIYTIIETRVVSRVPTISSYIFTLHETRLKILFYQTHETVDFSSSNRPNPYKINNPTYVCALSVHRNKMSRHRGVRNTLTNHRYRKLINDDKRRLIRPTEIHAGVSHSTKRNRIR